MNFLFCLNSKISNTVSFSQLLCSSYNGAWRSLTTVYHRCHQTQVGLPRVLE